jgi:hypothetical protein
VREKRRAKRYSRRLKLKFGLTDLSQNGATSDVSSSGCFIVHAKPPPLDTRLHIQLFTEGEKHIYYEATVRRIKQVPPELRTIERNGFGVQFLAPDDLLKEVLPHVAGITRLQVSFATEADLKKMINQEIKAGGAFIRTEKALTRDSEVLVELRLEFTRRNLEFPATVIHVQDSGVRGVGVTFDDPDKVRDALKTFML